jgi:hypothetical protein
VEGGFEGRRCAAVNPPRQYVCGEIHGNIEREIYQASSSSRKRFIDLRQSRGFLRIHIGGLTAAQRRPSKPPSKEASTHIYIYIYIYSYILYIYIHMLELRRVDPAHLLVFAAAATSVVRLIPASGSVAVSTGIDVPPVPTSAMRCRWSWAIWRHRIPQVPVPCICTFYNSNEIWGYPSTISGYSIVLLYFMLVNISLFKSENCKSAVLEYYATCGRKNGQIF